MFPINEVLEGDCTRVLKQLPDACVDFVLTDPPYGVRYQDSQGRTIANDDGPSRVLGAFTDLHRVLKPDRTRIFEKLGFSENVVVLFHHRQRSMLRFKNSSIAVAISRP